MNEGLCIPRHRAHSTLTQTQNFISHIHCIHHGGWRCNTIPCRPPSLLRSTSDTVGPLYEVRGVSPCGSGIPSSIEATNNNRCNTAWFVVQDQVGSTTSWMPDRLRRSLNGQVNHFPALDNDDDDDNNDDSKHTSTTSDNGRETFLCPISMVVLSFTMLFCQHCASHCHIFQLSVLSLKTKLSKQ